MSRLSYCPELAEGFVKGCGEIKTGSAILRSGDFLSSWFTSKVGEPLRLLVPARWSGRGRETRLWYHLDRDLDEIADLDAKELKEGDEYGEAFAARAKVSGEQVGSDRPREPGDMHETVLRSGTL